MIKPPTGGGLNAGVFTSVNQQTTDPPVIQTGLPQVAILFGAISSVKTPGWKSLSRVEKLRIKNPFNYQREVLTYAPGGSVIWISRSTGDQSVVGKGTSSGLGSTGFGPSHIRPPWASQEMGSSSAALAKVQTKVARMSVNLAQAYAERKQAVDMLTKRAYQIVGIASALRTGNLVLASNRVAEALGLSFKTYHKRPQLNKRKTSAEFASNWLEFQYGWRPLLSDIYGSCELIAKTYHEKRPTVITGRSAKEIKFPATPGFTWQTQGGSLCQQVWKDGSLLQEETRFVIECAEDDSLMTALSSTGISNPALLAWELMPYSFVVDWFVPVGNYLQQLEYARGMRFVKGTKSVRRVGIASAGSYVKSSPSTGSRTSQWDHNSTWTYYTKSRTVLSEWPYQKFPSWKPQLGVERSLNALALITQLITGSTPRKR